MFPFKLSLNASTLFPFELDLPQQIEIAAQAGYEGIEIWMRHVDTYLANGGTTTALRRHIEHAGITVANAIAFWTWADEDPSQRDRGFEQAKRELTLLAELGCVAAAAPPFGSVEGVSLESMATQFAALAHLARGIGVEPYLEFWGRAKRLSRLSEAIYVALESRVRGAKILLDPFHMYTGGSDLEWLSYLTGDHIGIVHVNDYPTVPAREVIEDRHRVFPGEGALPARRFAELLHSIGYRGFVSLELFIERFDDQSALDVARAGVESIKRAFSVEG